MTTPSTQNLHSLLGHLEHHLRFQKELGQTHVKLEPGTLETLKQAVSTTVTTSAPPPPKTAEVRPTPPAPSGQTAQTAPTPPAKAPSESAADQLKSIAREIDASDVCSLKETATHTVPGQGNPNPELVFIGEAPGEEEDLQGLAFVGKSGEVLTRMISGMGLSRDEVWIGNIVKWRPPNNRQPTKDEVDACMPFLLRQLNILQPKAIVCLGGVATKALLDTETGIMKLRGQWKEFQGIPLMPTYHPSFLLRSTGDQKTRYWEVWSDMEAVLTKLGKPLPVKKKT